MIYEILQESLGILIKTTTTKKTQQMRHKQLKKESLLAINFIRNPRERECYATRESFLLCCVGNK